MSPPHPHRGVVHLQFERHIMEKNEGNVCKFSNSNKKRGPDAGANWRVPVIFLFYLRVVRTWCKCKLAGTRHFVGYHRQSHVSRQTCAGGFWSSFWLLSFTLMWGSNLASYIPYSGPLGISLPSFDIRGISPLHPSSKVKPRMGVKFPVRRDFTRNNEKKWNVASRVCTTPNLNHTLQKTTQNSWKWANFTWFSTLWDDIALEKDQRRHHQQYKYYS